METESRQRVQELWTRRVIYEPWSHARATLPAHSQHVASLCFMVGVDFKPNAKGTHPSDLLSYNYDLLATLFSVAAYYGNVKPYETVCPNPVGKESMAYMVVQSPKAADGTSRAVVYHLFTTAPLSRTVMEGMRRAARGELTSGDRRKIQQGANPFAAAFKRKAVSGDKNPRQRKKARAAAANDGEAMDLEGSTSGSDEPVLGEADQAETHGPAGVADRTLERSYFRDGLSAHAAEGAYLDLQGGRLNKKVLEEVFGPRGIFRFPNQLQYLKPSNPRVFAERYVLPYYAAVRQASHDERRFAGAEGMSRLSTEELDDLLASAFTMGDALMRLTQMPNGTAVLRDYLSPVCYYSNGLVNPTAAPPAQYAAPMAAADQDAYYDVLRSHVLWAFQQGATAPTDWPCPDETVVVRGDYLLPELIMGRPFPYRLREAVDASDYTPSLEALVRAKAVLLSTALSEERFNGSFRHDDVPIPFDVGDGPLAPGLAEAMNGAMAEMRKHAQEEEVRARTALAARHAANVERLRSYAQLRLKAARIRLQRVAFELSRGRYPGLLSAPLPVERDKEEMDAQEIGLHFFTEDELDENQQPREEVLAQLRQRYGVSERHAMPLGIGDEGADTDAGEEDPLLAEALTAAKDAGDWGTWDPAIMATSRQMQLRAIISAKLNRLQRERQATGMSDADFVARRDAFLLDHGRRVAAQAELAGEVVEPDAIRRGLQAAWRIFEGNCTIHAPPHCNGSRFQRFMVWFYSSLKDLGKVTDRNMHPLLVRLPTPSPSPLHLILIPPMTRW